MSALRLLASLILIPAAAVALAADSPSGEPQLEKFSADSAWSADYGAAQRRARAEQKTMLLNFTGSDWCVWCHRLRDEVFVQKPFVDYARDHLVLVELDFPNQKPQSAEQKEQNRRLKEQFKVTGYPTVVLVDAEGRELGRTGYMQGGAKTFVRELRRFAAKQTAATKS